VRFLGGSDPINLTASTTLEIQNRVDLGGLAISPDGSSIAFDAGATKGTPAPSFDAWVVPAPLGGPPRKIVELGRAVRWSPDGTRILFIRPGSSAGDALFTARSDGGSPKEVVPVRGGMHIHWPVWSHDSRYIFFNYSISTANREPAEIYRVAADGGPIEPVVTSARRAIFPLPTPDGAGLIYAANPTGVDLALWWRPLDRPQPIRLTTGVGEYAEPSMAADGRTMISTLVRYRQTLTAFPISSTPSSPRQITEGSTGDLDPTLSPGGDQLVFSSSRSGFRNLWTARPDGTMARSLTSGNAFDERPAFSPDGQRLVFVSDRGGQPGIWVMSANGGIPEQVIKTRVIDRLVWSPDGHRVVYATTVDDLPILQSVGVADGTVQRIHTPGRAVSPFSLANDTVGYLEPRPGGPGTPNDNRVAFVRTNGEPVPADALRGLNLANGFAVLSPDGRRLAAVVDPGAATGSIWVADLNSGASFQKVTDLPSDVRPRGATWAPGSDALIVGTIHRTSHLVLFDQAK
jgi:Tol biopolymer transport system component